ncbi:hypothetical protein QO003_002055 [Arthrobacter silviterrae]|uniref:Uncharacterized protein n=1 Tax=Arthrobacter silviterrae TaxID=2026658 RepID=A0ABX0DDK8_9MICC|nr:hypothetical protein [Arthrobacter silviterrae]MDQ0277752.1 hypothetical protein [Arthrobacter silviterrae]NGN84997.1 hypothetical protein [Arthrobacter silviterrae]
MNTWRTTTGAQQARPRRGVEIIAVAALIALIGGGAAAASSNAGAMQGAGPQQHQVQIAADPSHGTAAGLVAK